MKKRDEAEYQAKVTDDGGLTRGKVPSPLLRAMGARPGDYMIFRLTSSGEAVMRVARSMGAGKRAKGLSGAGIEAKQGLG
jgi:hypothetical protein